MSTLAIRLVGTGWDRTGSFGVQEHDARVGTFNTLRMPIIRDNTVTIGRYLVLVGGGELSDDLANIMLFDEVRWANRSFRLRRQLSCHFGRDEEFVTLSCPDLGFTSYGKTSDEAKQEFQEEFAFVWDEYSGSSDSRLTPRARQLKHRLIELVDEVFQR